MKRPTASSRPQTSNAGPSPTTTATIARPATALHPPKHLPEGPTGARWHARIGAGTGHDRVAASAPTARRGRRRGGRHAQRGVWMGGRLSVMFEGRTWERRRAGSTAGPPLHLRPVAPPSTGANCLHALSWQRGRTHVRLRRSVPYPRSIAPHPTIHVEEYIPTVPDPGIHSSSVRIQHPATGDVMRDRTWAELDHE